MHLIYKLQQQKLMPHNINWMGIRDGLEMVIEIYWLFGQETLRIKK